MEANQEATRDIEVLNTPNSLRLPSETDRTAQNQDIEFVKGLLRELVDMESIISRISPIDTEQDNMGCKHVERKTLHTI